MHTGRTVFAQMMDLLPLQEFRGCVAHYQGEYKVRGFSCLNRIVVTASEYEALAVTPTRRCFG